jgi:hypothetical protein
MIAQPLVNALALAAVLAAVPLGCAQAGLASSDAAFAASEGSRAARLERFAQNRGTQGAPKAAPPPDDVPGGPPGAKDTSEDKDGLGPTRGPRREPDSSPVGQKDEKAKEPPPPPPGSK